MAAKSRTMAQQKTKEAYCFIVPAFIYMILVLGYPIVYNIILSLKDVKCKEPEIRNFRICRITELY